MVNHYQPECLVKKHLIQQIAMGIQKQRRVWEAEAAIGDRPIAEANPEQD
ncbi:hypothetical protein VB780_07410 [Leptolyngbya sp. CCNP1308]|nr:hypothetical protein [Leptolyngbya sp. CCNP1308]MEA5448388.1 hypothetical protein [Leptolyngbya sp. CCNP1308]